MPEGVPVTVITPTMPGREEWLGEACASVRSQEVKPYTHLVMDGDPGPDGPNPGHLARQRNRLAADVSTPWVACLDDDDTYLPHHFATIAPFLDGPADVIYTWPTEKVAARVNVTGWPSSLVAAELRRSNFVSSNACIRRSALEKVGGWSEDFDLATGRFPTGSTFRCVPVATWVYRLHDEQSSRKWRPEEVKA